MIQWGLVGAGAISNKRVGPALAGAENSRLVAVCDVDQDAARELAGRFGVEHAYAEFDQLLRDDAVDAVYLATPIFLHAPQALQALQAGKHVLVEKPMALTVAEAEEMNRTASRTGRTLATAYYRRFFPKVQRAKQLIAEGVLGTVVAVSSVYHTWYEPAPGAPGSWRAQKAQAGGGVLWDMGSHRFDLLIDLLGMPTHVWAATATLAHSYEVEDTATVFLRFGNGAQCASTWGWSSQTWIDHLALIGTQGKIILEPVDSPNFTLLVGKGRSQERFDEQLPLPDNVHLPMVQDFVDAVLAGRAPVEQGAEGEKVNRILAAVEESARTGCVLQLSQSTGEENQPWRSER